MRRRERARVPRRRVLVVCGGTRTEPDYLHGLRRTVAGPDVTLSIKATGKAPDQLVAHVSALAAHQRDQFDELWCVVDVDEFDLDPAADAARRTGVQLAVSNPCFEVWLLLHFEDCGSHVDGATDAARRLGRHLPAYDKTRLNFADFSGVVERAVQRAHLLDDGATIGPNPSSGMWKLVSMIVKEEP